MTHVIMVEIDLRRHIRIVPAQVCQDSQIQRLVILRIVIRHDDIELDDAGVVRPMLNVKIMGVQAPADGLDDGLQAFVHLRRQPVVNIDGIDMGHQLHVQVLLKIPLNLVDRFVGLVQRPAAVQLDMH